MRFYDNYGTIHKSAIKAKVANITTKIDKKMRAKLPGYAETIEAFQNINNNTEIEYYDVEMIDEEGIINVPSEEAKTFDTTSEETKESNIKNNKIEIDYVHNKLIFLDKNDKTIASSDIDDKLTSGTLCKLLTDTLYPDGNTTQHDNSFINSLCNNIMTKTDPRRDDNLHKDKDVIEIDKEKTIFPSEVEDSLSDNKG